MKKHDKPKKTNSVALQSYGPVICYIIYSERRSVLAYFKNLALSLSLSLSLSHSSGVSHILILSHLPLSKYFFFGDREGV